MTFIILHGTYGYPNENWFSWLAQKLTALGHKVVVPQFPTPENQTLDEWKRVFDTKIGDLTSDSVLIGHSTGAIFVPNLLNDSSCKIAGAFMVAGFWGEIGHEVFDPLNRSFLSRAIDWKKVRANAAVIRLFGSDNDPYVPREKTDQLAKLLSTKTDLVPGAGHFNSAAGYTEFPYLLAEISRTVLV